MVKRKLIRQQHVSDWVQSRLQTANIPRPLHFEGTLLCGRGQGYCNTSQPPPNVNSWTAPE
jgi:hypothetical protein